ncbi:MAG: Uma2 family endonuclease [Aggregatilineales bacterium]
MIANKPMTAEDFLAFAEQHPERRFDFLDGEIVEVSPSRAHSRIQALIAYLLTDYLMRAPSIQAAVHTEALHELAGVKFLPDVSVNHDEPGDLPYFTQPPLLAVEIRSETQSREAQRRKARAYIERGAALVWLVMPNEGVEVHRLGHEPLALLPGDTLDGGDVLPGFAVPVRRLFER